MVKSAIIIFTCEPLVLGPALAIDNTPARS
jgi:hypothetical protein